MRRPMTLALLVWLLLRGIACVNDCSGYCAACWADCMEVCESRCEGKTCVESCHVDCHERCGTCRDFCHRRLACEPMPPEGSLQRRHATPSRSLGNAPVTGDAAR